MDTTAGPGAAAPPGNTAGPQDAVDATGSDHILEMRGHHQALPPRSPRSLGREPLRPTRGDPRDLRRERGGRQVDPDEGALRGSTPHGSYDGDIVFEGRTAEFKSTRDSEHVGIVIIHQELALSPFLSIAENIFLGNERAARGVIDWNHTNSEAAKLLARVGLDERPDTRIIDIGVGKQQLVEIAKRSPRRSSSSSSTSPPRP